MYKSYWKKCLSFPLLAILTHQKSLYVYIHLPLSVSMMIKAMRRKWFTFKLTSKMYEAFSISHEQSQACLNYAMARKSMKIVNKQVKFLTSQYIGTFASAYTKDYALI